jgi:hypothetical protein
MEREAHMRAAIIDGVDMFSVGEDGDAMAAAGDNARLIDLLDLPHANEPINRHSHGSSPFHAVRQTDVSGTIRMLIVACCQAQYIRRMS